MGDRRCCCGAGCWIWSDDFDRIPIALTSNIGSDWNEVVGEWGIRFVGIDGMLYEEYTSGGTSGALVIGTNAAPSTNPGEMSFGITVVDPQIDDVFYLYPCCTDTSTVGPVVCKYTYLGSNEWETQIDGDAPVQQTGSDIGEGADPEFILQCCADHASEFVKASVGSVGEEYSWAINRDPGPGRYYGIGHDNTTNGATFDNFAVVNLRGEDNEICVECWCMCEQVSVPRVLTATIVADTAGTNRAACLNGETWGMTWLWRTPIGQWEGYVTIGVHELHFELYCEGYDPGEYPGQNWELVWASPVDPCNDGQVTLGAGPTSTCSPLSLVFGPYVLSRDNLACYLCYDPFPAPGPQDGAFYIVITI